jgi:hypothetical protein
MSILGKELEEFNFILQKHKFRIDSNDDVTFSLLTDDVTGIKFKKNGDLDVTIDKTFKEVVGKKIEAFSNIPAKAIYAENGDIVLEAKTGSIYLRGLKIIIEGVDGLGGEVIINSSKNLQMNAPIVNIQSDKFTAAATTSSSIAGGSIETLGQFANESATGTDEEKASFFGKILSAIKKFKEFFSSSCNLKP